MTLNPTTNPGAPHLASEMWAFTKLQGFRRFVCPIHRSLIAMSGFLLLTIAAQAAPKTLLANTFGANPDGHTLTTTAIQKALDEAAKTPGTVVTLAPGTYLTGSLFIKSNTTLRLDAGVTLLGSQNIQIPRTHRRRPRLDLHGPPTHHPHQRPRRGHRHRAHHRHPHRPSQTQTPSP